MPWPSASGAGSSSRRRLRRRPSGCAGFARAAVCTDPSIRPNLDPSPVATPGREWPRPRDRKPRGHGCVGASSRRERLEAGGEGIPPRQRPVRDRDLTSSGHTELLPQRVAMRLRRPWRDAQVLADLRVRASGCDQLDDLPLTLGDLRRCVRRRLNHAATVTAARGRDHWPKGVTVRFRAAPQVGPLGGLCEQGAPVRQAAGSNARPCKKLASWPRRFASRSSSSSSAPMRRSRSNSSRR